MVIKEDKAPEKNRFLKEGFSTGSLYGLDMGGSGTCKRLVISVVLGTHSKAKAVDLQE